MNRRSLIAGAALLVTACAPVEAEEKLILDLGDFEDYADWYEYDREEEPEPQPFEADPLVVTALGKVRAAPDIAVITATVSDENVNESRALDVVSDKVNAVQAALAGRDVETGFTALRSRPDYDQACLNQNAAARRRQQQIQNDYFWNKRLDDQGDTETRRRPPKPRLQQSVCQAEAIRISTDMVLRVRPAEAAGDVLRALGDAGAESAQLFGYDFSDYDALYAQAAEAAVSQARAKAEAVADGAGATLGEIVEMSVSAPGRTGRFGPQPTIIRPPRPSAGDGVTALEAYSDRNENYASGGRSYAPPPPPSVVMPEGDEDLIIVTASRRASPGRPAPITVDAVTAERTTEKVRLQDGRVLERTIPTVSRMEVSAGSNALTMSLMSGPQTIQVAARLSYAYPTPLDGIIIQEPEED